MKKKIKDWWFSITLFVVAILVMLYGSITIFIDDELYIYGGMLSTYLAVSLMLITLAYINQPRKENNNESKKQ